MRGPASTRARVWLGAAALTALLVGAVASWELGLLDPVAPVPSPAHVRAGHRPSDLLVLDRHGEPIHELRVDPARRRLAWVPLDQVSPALLAAVLASEDRRFFAHGGVDLRSVASAAIGRLRGRPGRGASTISMQLGALLDPSLRPRSGAKSLNQKWRQMRTARALESSWSKREILEAYLNLVDFRGELSGVGAATSILFGKAPHGVGPAEALVLAALIRAPGASPAAVTRRALALAAAAEGSPAGEPGPEDVARAATQATAAPAGAGPRVALAPHAVRRLLGATPAEDGGSSRVITATLDGRLQRFAAATLRRHLLAIRDQRVLDGAVLVLDNDSGDVLAYVGGSADLSSARHVDAVGARRQAGSSLKPFLYALAFEQRLLTPASLLEDAPLDLAVAGGLYRPRNYGDQFRGIVTARVALAGSLNVPAVRALDLVGAEIAVQRLRALGLALPEAADYYGPSLALGSVDVTLWDLANAYRALAAGGVWSPARLVPGAPEADARRVYSAEAAFLVSSVLADRESRSVTFGLENPLATGFWTAVKTGTSKDMRDNWAVGYSRRFTVGVWVGNHGGEPMRDVSGVTGAAPVWLEVMTWLHAGSLADPAPEVPRGVVARAISGAGGSPGRLEWFLRGTEPVTAYAALAPAAAEAKILAPVSGTIIALDPDIPPARQRVVFEARAAGEGIRWMLDGTDLGPAASLVPWAPSPGRHRLALVTGAGEVRDSVLFEVRGDSRPGAAELR